MGCGKVVGAEGGGGGVAGGGRGAKVGGNGEQEMEGI